MAEKEKSPGEIAWIDLSVDDASSLREFYSDVIGWTTTPVDMDGYNDFCMNVPLTGEPVSGVCHARGPNADLPPVWLVYLVVDDIDRSIANCSDRGGRVLAGPKNMGGQGRYCVLEDPAGAAFALFEYGASNE